MHLTIDGVLHPLVDIVAFRDAHGLPPEFGIMLFESKDWDTVGRIDAGGQALNRLRVALLEVIPMRIPFERLPDVIRALGETFRAQLEAINDNIGLKMVEIEFASAGFDDVLQAVLYSWAGARIAKIPPPTFEALYQTWLDASVRVSSQVHTYQQGEVVWQVRILNTIYGRAGLAVTAEGDSMVYVHDSALACPAEGFMVHLLKQTYEKLYNASVAN